MDLILAKILAVVLTLSQVSTRPDAVKTHFEPTDRAEVVTLLQAGCAHVRKVFELEDLQLDDLVETAMMDPQSFAGDNKVFKGLDFQTLHTAYRQFCKNETITTGAIDVGPVIDYFNQAAANLPDHRHLKGLRLPDAATVVDAKGNRLAEVYEPNGRRLWVPLDTIPERLRKAFVSAEDKRFFEHKGIDERGLVRAFVANMMRPGRPQGGSTITQQVVKNLLVGDDVTYERKIREIILATRVETDLSKQEILEIYLNTIYLGRNSWGVEMASRTWFGKSVKDVDLAEAALLAGLTKGPNYFNPDRAPDRARDRFVYVLERLAEDGAIQNDEMKRVSATFPHLAAHDRSRDNGYFIDYLNREAKQDGVFKALGGTGGAVVRATLQPELQRAAEASLQDGLAQYEAATGRVSYQGPEANLAEAISALPADPEPAWKRALANARLPLADIHWDSAVIIEMPGKKGGALKVGLADGRVLPLQAAASIARKLALYDVVLVKVRADSVRQVTGPDGVRRQVKSAARAEMRVRPLVQGAAVVLDNKTGGILAMAGGFSYSLSQLNRVSQTRRQPGSSIKPLTYLAALQAGLQPNTLVRDEPVTLPPINGGTREQDYWTPKNYGGGYSGVTTLRRALEHSKNLATVGLLDGGIAATPQQSLEKVCALMVEAQFYSECQRVYPVVLGAQPVRLLDLAAFYAAIANEGARPSPHAIARTEQGGRAVTRDDDRPLTWLGGADRVSFYQLKSMLQGVVARGTAASISRLSPYVAGKTGTSDDENDAWFAGFTNDVTVAVWVGYDNATSRRTLGGGQTGGHVAVPIFEQIVKAVWASYAPQVALAPPSPDAKRQLASLPIDLNSGDRLGEGGQGAFYEQFRVDGRGRLDDTQHRIVGEGEASYMREQPTDGEVGDYDRSYGAYGGGYRPYNGPQTRGLFGQPVDQGFFPFRGLFGQPQQPQQRQYVPPAYGERSYGDRRYYGTQPQGEAQPTRPRRVDPDYFWGERRYN
jgi:membrane carboxypeptidase/penicillin-binding protein